ncbi:hypothetical protein RDI58_006323 [Solanum bulbocastanum]|uniref:Uncharacterized protein n=1 Tax=Solanum bulbocastanum TaxID=147425 RepID=A0AAN8U281_SOLBU
MMDHFDSYCSVGFEVADDLNQVLNQRSNFLSGDSEKSSLTKDILDEDEHLVDNVKQTENFCSGLLPISPNRLLCHQILCSGPGFKMLIFTSLKMGLKLLLNMKLLLL